ncbi:MAG TPA: hypothetical protein VMH28_17930 [Candidatus Acidoferrales bacterium]|nr:hypothetical protein [Candidatus Acidoferrales bacterium]
MLPTVRISCRVAVPMLIILLAANVLGQQTYVTRFDLFTGYTYLNSPHVGLAENGFHTQFGVRPWTWMSLGFDYSVVQGDLTLTPNLLVPSVQQQLAAMLGQLAAAGKLPAGYALVVPASSTTQTFAGGPQLAFRHWKPITIFVRPSCGIIKETATPHAGDPIAAAVVAQLAPTGEKKDNVIFYGFGGGIDLLFSKHVAVRIQGDFVHDHLFSDLLTDSRNTVRFSIGPCFNFGKNIAQR